VFPTVYAQRGVDMGARWRATVVVEPVGGGVLYRNRVQGQIYGGEVTKIRRRQTVETGAREEIPWTGGRASGRSVVESSV
jgi:hypothetical protein